MTEERYTEAVRNLNFDPPRSVRSNWPRWTPPDRMEGESQLSHLARLQRFKAGYFETVQKLEDGGRLRWL